MTAKGDLTNAVAVLAGDQEDPDCLIQNVAVILRRKDGLPEVEPGRGTEIPSDQATGLPRETWERIVRERIETLASQLQALGDSIGSYEILRGKVSAYAECNVRKPSELARRLVELRRRFVACLHDAHGTIWDRLGQRKYRTRDDLPRSLDLVEQMLRQGLGAAYVGEESEHLRSQWFQKDEEGNYVRGVAQTRDWHTPAGVGFVASAASRQDAHVTPSYDADTGAPRLDSAMGRLMAPVAGANSKPDDVLFHLFKWTGFHGDRAFFDESLRSPEKRRKILEDMKLALAARQATLTSAPLYFYWYATNERCAQYRRMVAETHQRVGTSFFAVEVVGERNLDAYTLMQQVHEILTRCFPTDYHHGSQA